MVPGYLLLLPLAGCKGGQAPMLLSLPAREDPSPGSFSHVPRPRCLAHPCPHGVTAASG